MVDLAQLAAQATATTEWKRSGNRERAANPFEAKLLESWETSWEDGNGVGHKHGAPMELPVPNEELAAEVKKALRRAVRYLPGIGCSINDDEMDEQGNIIVKFRAQPLGRRKSNDES